MNTPLPHSRTFNQLLTALLVGLWLTLAGCNSIEPPTTPSPVVLELSQGEDGELQLCDENGECESHPNPNDCAVLLIEINTVTGESCERCLNEEGRVTLQRCGETSVACAVVTLPDPDCVVCAYVDGDVVYSSCIPEEPGYCVTEVDPNGTECERCYDGAGALVSVECHNDCRTQDCPQILCAMGYHPEVPPGACCETCVPDEPSDVCTSTQDCQGDQICTVELGECNPPPGCGPDESCLAVCYGVCQSEPSCDEVFCFAPPPECGPGTHLEMDYPNCCGVCVPDNQRCEEPDPSLTCRTTGCDDGFRCEELPLTVCVPSECFCDPESGEWICTDDCRAPMGCVPQTLSCEGPNPAITCRQTGCTDDLECRPSGEDGCVPSLCGCDGQTGQWICTEDCGQMVACLPPETTCEGPNPAITCHQTGCTDDLECRPSGADGCVPSACGCDGASGQWICTADCGQMVACLPPETTCEGPNPALTCETTGCPTGTECRVTGEDGCVPSRCKCDEGSDQWRCTRDCHPVKACMPIETHDCHSNEDCQPWEQCIFLDAPLPHPIPAPDAHSGCGGQCVPMED